MKNELDWEAIKAAGRKLGLNARAIDSWYERRAVPFKWWLPIVKETHGRVSLDALEASRPVRSRVS